MLKGAFKVSKAKLRLRRVYPLEEDTIQTLKSKNLSFEVLRKTLDPKNDIHKNEQNRIMWPLIKKREWMWEKGEFEIEPNEWETISGDYLFDFEKCFTDTGKFSSGDKQPENISTGELVEEGQGSEKSQSFLGKNWWWLLIILIVAFLILWYEKERRKKKKRR